MAKRTVVVVGGGISGCAAAVAAAKSGAKAILLERMEMLGGCAIWAGRVDTRYFTVREELRLMGCDDIFQVFEQCKIHSNVHFPFPEGDPQTKMLYDCTKIDTALFRWLADLGVEIRLQARVKSLEMEGKRIKSVTIDSGEIFSADAFVDATGGAGGMSSCRKYGTGCAMCFMRCPAFGDRVSIAGKAGVKELKGKKKDGSTGAVTAAYSLVKESLAPRIKTEMEQKGLVIIPIPKDLVSYPRTEAITASGNVNKGFAENYVLVDVGGFAKRIAGGYTPLSEIRKIPGLESALYADPQAGTRGNCIRYMAITPRDEGLKVTGIDNLYIAGEKTVVNGLGECVVTGVIAGHNAARKAAGLAALVLPRETEIGDFIAYVNEKWDNEALVERIHIFSGPYWRRALTEGLFTEDRDIISNRIIKNKLSGILSQKII